MNSLSIVSNTVTMTSREIAEHPEHVILAYKNREKSNAFEVA